MNDREKLLAWATGSLLGIVLLYWGYSTVSGWYTKATATLAAIEDKIGDQETKLRRGRRASRQIAMYESQSSPSDLSRARALYQEWLFDWLAAHDVKEISVKPQSGGSSGDLYNRLRFRVTGQGNLAAWTNLLYDFYAVDHLHKLQNVTVQPMEDSRDLEFSFLVEALSMPATENEQLVDHVSPRLANVDRESYIAPILERNLFAPPNQAPRLASLGTQRVEQGESARFTVKATDADALDKVRYRLAADAPDGASIDANSGSFRWRPPQELGNYKVTVIATDTGVPAKQDRREVTIQVVAPKPVVVRPPEKPPLRFDNAKHAYLTGTIEVAGNWQMWLELRTKGELLKLRVGDAIDIGSVQGTISAIAVAHVEITTETGRLLLGLGEPLSDATKLPLGDL